MFYKLIFGILLLAVIISCDSKAKVISPSHSENTSPSTSSTGIFDTQGNSNSDPAKQIDPDVHEVIVKEILPTDKYVYLRVDESGEEYWIAAPTQEIEMGGKYYYRGGLLKTNFESKTYNRVFEKVYLVSTIVSASHASNQNPIQNTNQPSSKDQEKKIIELQEGSIRISEIVANPSKYDGKTIQLTGECVKINEDIMERNWIHLRDGSQDDYDLIVTSDIAVPVGHIITLSGTVATNKDFGAGYKYEIIIENGSLVNN